VHTFKCRDHSIDTSGTLNTSVHSPVSHFNKHLKCIKEILVSVKDVYSFMTGQLIVGDKPLELACHNLLDSQTQ